MVREALEEPGQHRRYEGDDRNALPRHRVRDGGRLEAWLEHHRLSRDEATDDDGEPSDVRDGHAEEPPVVGVPAEVSLARRSGREERPPAEDDAFRMSRGAGREEHAERRLVVDGGGSRARRQRACLLELDDRILDEEQSLAAGVHAREPRALGRRQARVKERRRYTARDERVDEDQGLDARRRDERDAAGTTGPAVEPRQDAGRALGELGERVGTSSRDERDALRARVRGLEDRKGVTHFVRAISTKVPERL